MTDNQFDEFFRDKLQQHTSQVPEDMWQRIQANKDKDHKRFFFGWYFIGAVLLLVAFTTGYFIITPNKRSADTNRISKRNMVYPTVDSTGLTSHKNDTGLNRIGEKITPGYTAKNDPTAGNKENAIANKKKITAKNLIEEKNEKNLEDNTRLDPDKKVIAQNVPATTLDPYHSKGTTKQLNADSSVSSENTIKPNKNSLQDTIAGEQTVELEGEAAKEQTVPMWIDLYASPDIALSKITSENSGYAAFRKKASNMQLSYTAGARISIPFGKNFSGKLGVQYSQANEKFIIYDSVLNSGQTYHNHYKTVDFPVLLGYQLNKKNIQVSINTGVVVNISSKYSGTILTPFYQPVDIGSSGVYKRNTGISLYLGLAIYKPLNERWYIYTEPYFRYRLKSMTGTFQPFDQKIHVGGLSLGVRYNFFNKGTESEQ